MKHFISQEGIENKIFWVRGYKVMLDSDLAELYQVETKRLNEQARRNLKRFPEDFMFRLTMEETERLRSQIATSKRGRGGQRYLPYAFTELGVAMLSSVLNSERAIQANIQIMRTFMKLRQWYASNRHLRKRIDEIEKKYDYQFKIVFDTIRKLIVEEEKPKHKIGFYHS